MIKRICPRCGDIFLSEKEQFLCPACRYKAAHEPRLVDHVCKQCGAEFTGGPRASYCPKCRQIRKAEAGRRHKKNGTSRKIGSTDICENCGKPYIVNGGLQKYCPDCAKKILAEKVNPIKRAYAEQYRKEHPDYKKAMRENATVCVVCGKPFTATKPTNTCSPECAAIRKKTLQKKQDDKRSGNRKRKADLPQAEK